MCEVYVIASESGHTKIGISENSAARLSVLQTASPFRLRLHRRVCCRGSDGRELAMGIERRCHDLLGAYRTSGEWFAVDANIAELALFAACDEGWKHGRTAAARYQEIIAQNPDFKVPQNIIAIDAGLQEQMEAAKGRMPHGRNG